jgi:hypothetical protein
MFSVFVIERKPILFGLCFVRFRKSLANFGPPGL